MNRIIAVLLVLLIPLGCTDPAVDLTHHQDKAVIGGESDFSALGVELSPLEQNTVVAQRSTFMGIKQLGCTGTVVGDRVVIVAGHCVIDNLEQWQAGAAPVMASPDTIEYAVGPDSNKPLCSLKVESVHLHPNIGPNPVTVLEHDLGLAILKDSVIDTCPHVVPAQINNDDLTDDFIGKELVQGGFGSTDGSYDFSPTRYWALVELAEKNDSVFIIHSIGKGFPTNGDSGAGALLRFPDGSLRILGVVSAGSAEWMAFPRLDRESAFLESVLDSKVRCGNVDDKGTCVGNTLVTCDSEGFSGTDCTKAGSTCAVDDAGGAGCECPCDKALICDESCACDADCPCACDSTSGCEADCSCDGDCAATPADGGTDGAPQTSRGVDEGGCATARGGRCSLFPLVLLLLFGVAGRRRLNVRG